MLIERIPVTPLRERNAKGGYHFFEPDTMRFFRSRVHGAWKGPGGTFFVTSEQFEGSDGKRHARRYSVRGFDWTTGDVRNRHHEFQKYETQLAASRAAQRYARDGDDTMA